MSEQYTGRRLKRATIGKIEGVAVSYEGGWVDVVPEGVAEQLSVGQEVVTEYRGFNEVGGMLDPATGTWYFRRSDEWFEEEHRRFRENVRREHRELVEANRDDWERRTRQLPGWVKARIENFQTHPGFEADGWGYELVVAELAVMYAEHGAEGTDEPEEVMAYAAREGTSGNQHGVARMLARAHLAGYDVSGTPSALTPITGDPFYDVPI